MALIQAATEKIMIPLYKHLLPRLKIGRCLPLEFIYYLYTYRAMRLTNIFVEQTIARLSFIMMHRVVSKLPVQQSSHSMEIL